MGLLGKTFLYVFGEPKRRPCGRLMVVRAFKAFGLGSSVGLCELPF